VTLAVLAAEEFAFYDEEAELVWVPEAAAHQIGETLKPGDKRRDGVEKVLAGFLGHPYGRAFLRRYKEPYSLRINIRGKPLVRPSDAPSKPGTGSEAGPGAATGTGTPPHPPANGGGSETRPAFGLFLEEASCPACRNRGSLRNAARGMGFFCGTRTGGCGQTFDLAEPSVLSQLTPRARDAIERRLAAQVEAAGAPRPAPAPKEPDPEQVAAERAAWREIPTYVEAFLRWYGENPEAGEVHGRRGMHGVAFGHWPGRKDLSEAVRDEVRRVAVERLEKARRRTG
jgi:hypothetical protein